MHRLKWGTKEMKEYQDKNVRSVIHNAFENIALYHRLLKSRGVYPSDIKGVSDLGKIPIVDKPSLKKESIFDLISKKCDLKALRQLSTGGSTGQPFTLFIKKEEDAWRKAIYLRANICCGQRAADKWVTIIDPQYGTKISILQKIVKFYTREIIPVTTPRMEQYQRIKRMRPDVLDGFPSNLHLLATEAQEDGFGSIHPRIIFGSGELVEKNAIAFIEKVFSAPYFDQFGCTEIDRSAWQCTERENYHLDSDSVIMQLVDKEGNEVGPDEQGEIVYTSLFNYAFPIIRYNVKDIAVKTNDECVCGLKLPLMKVVMGRSNSLLVFSDNKVISPMRFIETLGAFRLVEEIEEYKVVQQSKSQVNIYVKKLNDKANEESIRLRLLENLKLGFSDMKSTLDRVDFKVSFVDEIPHTARGKLNVVSSDVSNEG
jgi:phenylacetate-CoA ligase